MSATAQTTQTNASRRTPWEKESYRTPSYTPEKKPGIAEGRNLMHGATVNPWNDLAAAHAF
jgi:hypothetical protein